MEYLGLYVLCFAIQFSLIFGLINGTCRNVDKQYIEVPEKLDRGGWVIVWVFSALPLIGLVGAIGGVLCHPQWAGFSWKNGGK